MEEAAIGSKKLLDKIAIVTGASSGIGRETALQLAADGAHVALAARNEEALAQVAAGIEAMGRQALVVPTDVTLPEQVKALVAKTIGRWGRVDIVVANAGEYIRRRIIDLDTDILRRSMEINFYSAVQTALAALPHMRQQQSGHIILVSTMDSKKGLPYDAPYVAAKFALTGIGEVMRQELRPHGIFVTTVLPGRVDTPMIANLRVPWISAKVSARDAARALVRGMHQRKPEVIVPTLALALLYLNVISPTLGDWATKFFHLEGWESETA